MENDMQIKKQLISDKHIENPIVIKEFDGSEEYEFRLEEELKCLKNTIIEIHEEHPDHNILVLARTNKMLNYMLDDEEFIDSIGTNVIFKELESVVLDAMTMHKSKGLTFDEVIVIGLNNNFPLDREQVWLSKIYKNQTLQEPIPYAEERRLFYVALTRTKNKVYLLKNSNHNYRSQFFIDLEQIMEKQK